MGGWEICWKKNKIEFVQQRKVSFVDAELKNCKKKKLPSECLKFLHADTFWSAPLFLPSNKKKTFLPQIFLCCNQKVFFLKPTNENLTMLLLVVKTISNVVRQSSSRQRSVDLDRTWNGIESKESHVKGPTKLCFSFPSGKWVTHQSKAVIWLFFRLIKYCSCR